MEHRDIDVRGVRIHVGLEGDPDDPPVVLIHGWPQHGRCWREVVPKLQGRYVIVPDLRGFGKSDAPAGGYDKKTMATDIVGVLDQLGVERAVVVGHDWGGYVAWMIALHHPARVERLVVLSMIHPWYKPDRSLKGAMSLWYQLFIVTPGLNRLASPVAPRLMQRMGAAPFSDEDVRAYSEPYKDPKRVHAAAQVYRTFPVRELGRDAGKRATMPVTVATGTEDPVIFPERIRGVQADDLREEVLEAAGHFLPETHPDEVAALILQR